MRFWSKVANLFHEYAFKLVIYFLGCQCMVIVLILAVKLWHDNKCVKVHTAAPIMKIINLSQRAIPILPKEIFWYYTNTSPPKTCLEVAATMFYVVEWIKA